MRDWVDQHCPGTKLAVTEYDFYDHDQPIGAVTYAEVLGIFARQGLDMATAWAPPGPSEPAFAAFKLFRNFDGNGGKFESVSVRRRRNHDRHRQRHVGLRYRKRGRRERGRRREQRRIRQ
jgi:hypothetical protein